MDYDRYDAFLHHIFKQTQGDAWFRPNEDNIAVGVALRVDNGEYRVFPYENLGLEPFEAAVRALNPAVAVKVRSAAVHAAFSEVGPGDKSIYIDANTRIQILDTMVDLPTADKEQNAAFVRDERVLVVWSDSIDTIIPICHDFEERLIKLLWRSRPGVPGSHPTSSSGHPASATGSVSGHSMQQLNTRLSQSQLRRNSVLPGTPGRGTPVPGTPRGVFVGSGGVLGMSAEDLALDSLKEKEPAEPETVTKTKRTWWGGKKTVTIERQPSALAAYRDVEAGSEARRTVLLAPIYNGLAAGLSMFFIGNGINILLEEVQLDGNFIRLALAVLLPLLFCVSLFFALQIVQNLSMCIGPVGQYHKNSKYYSAVPPRPNKMVDNNLPHITIQMPVYKEGLDAVLAPSIETIKKAMQTYARQGGTSTIFINDDGLRLLSVEDRDARILFYANHGIGWVARPKHDDSSPDGFKRAGRFKKASNMNYGLSLSLKAEKYLAELLAREKTRPSTEGTNSSNGVSEEMRYGMQYQNHDGEDQGGINQGQGQRLRAGSDAGSQLDEFDDLEEKALQMAIDEVYEASGRKFRPWAANGRACRLGEIILLVDSDTVVPEDCLRDAAREMAECPTVAIIQHGSDVMQVAHHYFENGIAYFTRRINKCISLSCANGEVAPFVGHNAFLRWKALQDAAFVDPLDGQEKIWSESNVSEDFDMALRLQMRGYIIRWATYSKGGFKEGVSLTVDDELNRWQKYAYGCNELLFNPFAQWWKKGPIAHQIHRFLWSGAPLHYKFSMMAYMFSYYGIAASITISLINYVLLGFQLPVDGFYMHSFEIWLATTVVFFGSGNVGFTLLEYRLGEKSLLGSFFENIMWIPFFFFFFGGLSIPVSQAILAHCFSYNMTWGATKKEVERSNFFKEIPKIFKRFWFSWLVAWVVILGMVVLSTPLIPIEWRIDGSAWAVIFPLAVVAGCHVLFPIVLNPWLMVFSY
ncbi:glycosyl transferase family group 2-domain-containing protein [Dichomitus squalens]|uniref:Glycosyl transferase family group 2-domain-containing protein n=1 Tax=Dichomitus squalens TaxID=114155 RepID=A0A4Q9NII0_9APHY|nr:glycosyl transferase family group 2-domain-containing protein [Dichomitus squalens]TBU39391.1 glycosyl transferase family group 2-domain-containing protein [Dichomitus squalens]TBU51982.1 glycosyl transferase family group 2-domain-containing protein [Dichomitus squalens]